MAKSRLKYDLYITIERDLDEMDEDLRDELLDDMHAKIDGLLKVAVPEAETEFIEWETL
jgi:hypothetical protein